MLQAYARATISTNLRDRDDRFNDTDRLKAVALAGSALGATLVRLKAGHDASVFSRALDGIIGTLQRQQKPAKHARAAILYWLCDRCPACHGRGFEKVFGAPVLSEIPCKSCAGTGVRALPDDIRPVVALLDQLYQRSVGEAKNKLFANHFP